VREKAHEPEGRRPQELHNRADTFEGLQDLLCFACGDALAVAQRLAGESEVVAGGAGSGDAMGLRVFVDLAPQRGVNLHAHETGAHGYSSGPHERRPEELLEAGAVTRDHSNETRPGARSDLGSESLAEPFCAPVGGGRGTGAGFRVNPTDYTQVLSPLRSGHGAEGGVNPL